MSDDQRAIEAEYWRILLTEAENCKDLSLEEILARAEHLDEVREKCESLMAEALKELEERDPVRYQEVLDRKKRTDTELERLIDKAKCVVPGPDSAS